MALTISFRHELATIADGWVSMQRQIPFAAALALTRTAQDIQRGVRAGMPGNFTLRRQWVVQGIRIKMARKDFLQSEVYSRDPFMAIQESGGTKTSIRKRVWDYGEYLAIPLDARRSKADIVKKADWPQNLIKPFVLTANDGRKYLAVHATTNKSGPVPVSKARGKARRASGNRLMYILVKRYELRERLGMGKLARETAAPSFQRHMRQALLDAIGSRA
jgi:hypothetical protein